MNHLDLERIARDAEVMNRCRKLRACLKDLAAAIFIGLLLCAPIFWQMAVDAGWWKD